MATMEFDDGQSSWYGDFDWLPEESHGFPAATTHEVPDAPSRNETIREPLNTDEPNTWIWRCLGCDSCECTWKNSSWSCRMCGGCDFYRTNSPIKKVNQQGTWMFVPFGGHGGPEGSPSPPAHEKPPDGAGSGARRRRRRRHHGGGPADEPGDSEAAESEALTNDPVIDPDQQREAPRLPQARPKALPERPPGRDPPGPGGGGGLFGGVGSRPGSSDRQDPLLRALKQLVQSREGGDDDWSLSKGPSKGVRWKTGAYPTPPVWKYEMNDVRAFPKFEKKIRIWEKQMAQYASKADQALFLFGSLTGEPEQELEFLDVETIHTPGGIELILDTLRRPLEQKLVYQKRRFIAEFENMRRYPSETMRAFINRFRRSLRSLRTVGINMDLAYDPEALGSRLLDRSGLGHEAQRLVLVGTQQSLNFDALAEALVLQWPDFRGAPPIAGGNTGGGREAKGGGKGNRSAKPSFRSSSTSSSPTTGSSNQSRNSNFVKKVYVTENDPEQEDEHLEPIDEENDEDEEASQDDDADEGQSEELQPDEEPDFGELAEVLTLTAKKLSGMTLGRKFTGRPKTKGSGKGKSGSIEDTKKNTHCSVCGGQGHWYQDPECPANGGKGGLAKPKEKNKHAAGPTAKPHKVAFIHHEHGATEISSPSATSYGNMFTVGMVQHCISEKPYDDVHAVHEVTINGPESFAGYLVLDTGCQRTCCGQAWFDAHSRLLREHDLAPKVIHYPDSFKFGKGTPSHSEVKMYAPSAIGGAALLLAGSVLAEGIPFLASNSLLTSLGAVFNLVNDTVVFVNLGGARSKIERIGGHMTLNILDFQHSNPKAWNVWNEFSHDDLWSEPHPEFVLSNQVPPADLTSLRSEFADDPISSVLVGSMASPCEPHQERDVRHYQDDDGGNQPWTDSKGDVARVSTTRGVEDVPKDLPAHFVQEVRECSRPLRNMPSMRKRLEMESRSTEMGVQGSSWIKRSLYSLAAFATTFLSNDLGATTRSFTEGQGGLSSTSFGSTSKAQGEDLSTGPWHRGRERSLDELSRDGPSIGAFEPGTLLGGVQHNGADASIRQNPKDICRARLLQRADVPSREEEAPEGRGRQEMGALGGIGSDQHGGRPSLRLGRGGELEVKPGTAKRLRGLWKRSSNYLQAEHDVYLATTSTSSRPPPAADLWELFAGRALCSQLAHEYDLVAIQPFDLIYGQDFKKKATRTTALKTLDTLRPLLVMLEIDCRHYTIFNKNLNYSHRPLEWQQLQEEDHPLLTFTITIAKKQVDAGRFFFVENPERSELWSKPEVKKLANMSGVFSFVMDSGCFGAEIDGDMIAKPFRILTNFTGLDEILQHRLTAEQRQACTPIQGALTRRSQEYPEMMCRSILLHLREFASRLQPTRFCYINEVLPVQTPTEDLSQWDEIVLEVNKSFENTSRRPYYIVTSSDIGAKIQDLFRLDANKIQAVMAPTTRRVPSNIEDYSTRAAFLLFNDDSRSVEMEDLTELRFPKQRFSKPVRLAIFAYGFRRGLPEPVSPEQSKAPTMVPNLPTDIDFPGLSPEVPQEVRSSVARLHLNLGHPSRQELSRLLAYEGNLPDVVHECARKLRCATCERLKPKQAPRPSGQPSLVIGQFGDELQMDVFYCRTLTTQTFIVLGMVDRATGLQQAVIIPDRSGDAVFEAFEKIWLRPYGIPVHISCDPDTSFRGNFQARVQALGCMLEHCPAEAHYIIGMIERRNALLRTILEKLIDQFAATTIDECSTLLAAACHAINSSVHTHGRSAYQAVFGRQPRLINSNFNDPMVLATSGPMADLNNDSSAAYKAEFVRCEALKTLHQLDCSQHLRRALLRKTRVTKIADLNPGQPCAFWRWTKRGSKKRGSWVLGRFLSWDPSHVGKQAWIRSGATTTLVTSEQLRAAFGYEDWVPSKEDIGALKDAANKFELLLDDRGNGPPDDLPLEEGEMEPMDERDQLQDMPPLTPAMMAPATPSLVQPQPSLSPQPPIQQQDLDTQLASVPHQPSSLPQITQTQTSTVNINIDSPTNISNQLIQQQQQFHRFGDMPTQTTRRTRSRTPTSKRIGAQTRAEHQLQTRAEQQLQTAAELPAVSQHVQQLPDGEQAPIEDMINMINSQAPGSASAASHAVSRQGPILVNPQAEQQQAATAQQQQTGDNTPPLHFDPDTAVPMTPQQTAVSVSSGSAHSAANIQTDEYMQTEPQPQLPQKRPFDSLFTLAIDEQGCISRTHSYWDGSPFIGYGPSKTRCHEAYLTTDNRQQDTQQLGKDPNESDTTQGSDTEDSDIEQPKKDGGKVPSYKQGMTRQEVKALDREIPWRKVLEMDSTYIEKFLTAIQKEADSWSTWQSVEPLSDEEASRIFKHPRLKHRVLKSRACYRDKSLGIGEVRAKCRIVALGHLDPDLRSISRNSATPGRIAEHVLYSMLVAGYNGDLFESGLKWRGWSGDAATAFLQGQQSERSEPLFLLPPSDGLISMTSTWQSRLYRIRGNVYGLANAPFTWQKEVMKRLDSLQYKKHSFDHQLFYKVVNDEVISILLVYVDDFIGIARSDYNIAEVHNLFKWGSLDFFEVDKPTTFKGKELTLTLNEKKRYVLKITMSKFINGLDLGRIEKGRLKKDLPLSESEQKELRSVSGCLQWAATQARPEIASQVSLTPHGSQAGINDLKSLFNTIQFLKETPNYGIVMQDVPVNKETMVISYSDASWANARKSGSQIGALIGLTTANARNEPANLSLIDWKSSRSVRVCRSTLAAEASAGDEAADRSAFINMFIGELVHGIPSHRVGCRLQSVQATDAKSLYDAIISQNPNMADKRTLVSVRAIQESVSGDQIHWLPTRFQFADGLTKVDERLRSSFTRWLQRPVAILVEHPKNAYFEDQFFQKSAKLDDSEPSPKQLRWPKKLCESQQNVGSEKSMQ